MSNVAVFNPSKVPTYLRHAETLLSLLQKHALSFYLLARLYSTRPSMGGLPPETLAVA